MAEAWKAVDQLHKDGLITERSLKAAKEYRQRNPDQAAAAPAARKGTRKGARKRARN